MSHEKDSLVISMNMAFDGIAPDMVREVITDYTIAKSEFRKLRLKLSIKEIDKIAFIMLFILSEHQYSKDIAWIAKTLKDSNYEIMDKIREELKIYLSLQLCDSIIDVYSRVMHKPHSIWEKPSKHYTCACKYLA